MKRLAISALFSFLTLFLSQVQARTLLVRQDGSGDYETLHSALAASIDGNEIVIGPGIWTEPLLTIRKNLVIRSESGAANTILDGQLANRLMHFAYGADCQISGLTFTKALFNDGGAVHVDNAAQVRFFDCIFSRNRATHVGGAAYVRHPGSDVTFTNCEFLDNFGSLNAGGVGVSREANCHFIGCLFKDNESTYMAGALANYDGALIEVTNCLFIGNKGGECGAIRVFMAPAIIEKSTFFKNTSDLGTFYFSTGDMVLCRNNIFYGDTSGYGVYGSVSSGLQLSCNIFFENALGAYFGLPNERNNLIADPLFCIPEFDDFSLCNRSPAAPKEEPCGLIGAFGLGCENCGLVFTETRTWDGLKAIYRDATK